jgi:transposase
MHELERVKVIEAVIEGRLRCFQAAERLDLCERQISRLCRRYEAEGPSRAGVGQAWQAEQP